MLLVLEDVERQRHGVDDAERFLVCRKRVRGIDLLVTLAWAVNLVEIEQHRTSQYTILSKGIETSARRAIITGMKKKIFLPVFMAGGGLANLVASRGKAPAADNPGQR